MKAIEYTIYVTLCFSLACHEEQLLSQNNRLSTTAIDSGKYDFDSTILNCYNETMLVFPEGWEGTVCDICGIFRADLGDTLFFDGMLNEASYHTTWSIKGSGATILGSNTLPSVALLFDENFKTASLYVEQNGSDICTDRFPIVQAAEPFEKGQLAEGGILLYDKGHYSDGWRYLEGEVAYYGKVRWGLEGLWTAATDSSIGNGYANSWRIFDRYYQSEEYTEEINEYPAVGYALRYQNNFYNDWYLPSAAEAQLIREYLLNSYEEGSYWSYEEGFYWTSTEITDSTALAIDFHTGFLTEMPKNFEAKVLAVRYF